MNDLDQSLAHLWLLVMDKILQPNLITSTQASLRMKVFLLTKHKEKRNYHLIELTTLCISISLCYVTYRTCLEILLL